MPLSGVSRLRSPLTGLQSWPSATGNAWSSVAAAGSGRVNLWFEGVAFDALVGWLEGLRSQFGVSVDEFAVERAVDTGTVNARIGVVEAPAS